MELLLTNMTLSLTIENQTVCHQNIEDHSNSLSTRLQKIVVFENRKAEKHRKILCFSRPLELHGPLMMWLASGTTEPAMLNAWEYELCQWWRMCTIACYLNNLNLRSKVIWYDLQFHHLFSPKTRGHVQKICPSTSLFDHCDCGCRSSLFLNKTKEWILNQILHVFAAFSGQGHRLEIIFDIGMAARQQRKALIVCVRCQSSPAISFFSLPRVRKPFLQFIFFPLQQRGCTEQDFLNSLIEVSITSKLLYQQVEERW